MTDASTRILAGQKALVTGANSGIGAAAAIALGEAGAGQSDYVIGATLFVDGRMTLFPDFAEGG